MQAEIEANSRTESVTARGARSSLGRALLSIRSTACEGSEVSAKMASSWEARETTSVRRAFVPVVPALAFGAAVGLVVWAVDQLLPRGYDEVAMLRWVRTLADHLGRTISSCVFLAWAATFERNDPQMASRGAARAVEAGPGQADPGKIGPFNI